jgi:hypothetical protein
MVAFNVQETLIYPLLVLHFKLPVGALSRELVVVIWAMTFMN